MEFKVESGKWKVKFTAVFILCADVGEDTIFPPYRVRRLREADSFPYTLLSFIPHSAFALRIMLKKYHTINV